MVTVDWANTTPARCNAAADGDGDGAAAEGACLHRRRGAQNGGAGQKGRAESTARDQHGRREFHRNEAQIVGIMTFL